MIATLTQTAYLHSIQGVEIFGSKASYLKYSGSSGGCNVYLIQVHYYITLVANGHASIATALVEMVLALRIKIIQKPNISLKTRYN